MLHIGRIKAVTKFLEERIASDGSYLMSSNGHPKKRP